MIAVYFSIFYACNTPAKNMYVVEVEDDNFDSFLERLGTDEYPYPYSEVLFLEGDKVINKFSMPAGGFQYGSQKV